MAATVTAETAIAATKAEKQNITLSLSKRTLQKARVLAAKRGTSVSGLLTQQVEELVSRDDDYQRAKAEALAMLRSGFGFSGIEHMTRDEMHDRKALRESVPND
jgi:cytosine/adenosine deaminase-related metal-dependent hydrolase